MNKNIGSQNNVFKKWQTVLADDCRRITEKILSEFI